MISFQTKTIGWVGALWIIFVCFYILILKCVIIEKSYFGQVMTFYPGFNILYEKKFWGPLGAPFFLKTECTTMPLKWGIVVHLRGF